MKSTKPSQQVRPKTKIKKEVEEKRTVIQPMKITSMAIMMLGKTEDMTFVRTGGSALVDLGIDNPIEAWTKGNYSKAASLIREELGLPELDQEYVRIANSLQSIGLAHKLVSTLADTLIQIATIRVFFKTF